MPIKSNILEDKNDFKMKSTKQAIFKGKTLATKEKLIIDLEKIKPEDVKKKRIK